MKNIIIGVDGGGTKTKTIAYSISDKKIIGQAIAGGLNRNGATLSDIKINLKKAFCELNVNFNDVFAVSVGDPAADDDTSDGVIISLIKELGVFDAETKYFCCSDAFFALYAFTRGNIGTVMIAGTGSIGLGFKDRYVYGKENQVVAIGGWGYPTNDSGSGYAIAVNGINSALNSIDGVEKPTFLVDELMRFCKVKDRKEIISVLNGGISKSELAKFAMIVDKVSDKDETARSIIEKAGVDLGKYAISLLKTTNANVVGYYGSVLKNSLGVRQSFINTVKNEILDVQIKEIDSPPELGAVYFVLDANILGA